MCLSGNKLQQNSNACSKEEYISQKFNIDCFEGDSLHLRLTFVAFCLLSVIQKQTTNYRIYLTISQAIFTQIKTEVN